MSNSFLQENESLWTLCSTKINFPSINSYSRRAALAKIIAHKQHLRNSLLSLSTDVPEVGSFFLVLARQSPNYRCIVRSEVPQATCATFLLIRILRKIAELMRFIVNIVNIVGDRIYIHLARMTLYKTVRQPSGKYAHKHFTVGFICTALRREFRLDW